MGDNKSHRHHVRLNHIDRHNTCTVRCFHQMHTYQSTNKSQLCYRNSRNHSTVKIFHLRSPFTVQHLCRCSVQTRHRLAVEGSVYLNTDQRGMFNQPRSPCVAMRCCWRRSWENRGTATHLYSFQMACVSRIMQIWDFFLRELKPRCHANRHTHPRHSKNIIYGSAVSITNASHSALTHWEQCKNGLQFELVGYNPVPPMFRNSSAPNCSLSHTHANVDH